MPDKTVLDAVMAHLKNLRLGSLVGAYGLSQMVVMAASLARFPAIASSSGATVLALTFLWSAVQSWGTVLSGGRTNNARLHSLSSGNVEADSFSFLNWSRASLILCLLLSALIFADPIAWLAPAGPALLCLVTSFTMAKYVGFVQAQGKVERQFFASAVGSVFSLVMTLGITELPTWHDYSEDTQVFALVWLSYFSYASPYIYAWILSRKVSSVRKQKADGHSKISTRPLFELAAVLPPAFVSGFDALFLRFSSTPAALAEYGLVTRVGLLTTVVVSALYVQQNNLASGRKSISSGTAFRDGVRLFWLTVPFAAVFAFTCAPIVGVLSGSLVAPKATTIIAVLLVSLIMPLWIGASATAISKVEMRLGLGRIILCIVLPLGIIATFLFAEAYGPSGPIYASAITYSAAFVAALFQIRKYENRVLKGSSSQ